MTLPSDSDFNLYDGTPFTQTDWDANFQKIVTILTNGSYDFNINQITAGTYVGLPGNSFSSTTGEDITAGDIVRLSGGLIYKATNANSAGITGVVGISTTTTVSGQTATVSSDFYTSFAGLTTGIKYYVGVNGAKVTTKPSLYPFELGTSVSTTRINMSLNEDLTPTGSVITTPLSTAPEG